MKAERRYFLRVGDEAKEMPRSMLGSQFSPKPTFRIQVEIKSITKRWNCQFSDANGRSQTPTFSEVSLRNISEHSIDAPILRLEAQCSQAIEWSYPDDNNGRFDFNAIPEVKMMCSILHPKVAVKLNVVFLQTQATLSGIPVKFTVYAKDMLPKEGQMVFSGETASVECL